MKTKLKGMLTLLCALIMQISFAQERTVTGVVTDQGGFPIPGVNVIVRGQAAAVATDFDGKYSIQAAPTDVLVFTFVGMETREITASSTTLNVQMADSAQELEQVIVTAVGIRREKSSIGAATTTLRSEEILKGQQGNVADAIKGKVAGVVVSSSSTDPGASSGIFIRGIKSLEKGN